MNSNGKGHGQEVQVSPEKRERFLKLGITVGRPF